MYIDTFPFYVAVTIHLGSLVTALVGIIVVDSFGVLWILRRVNAQSVVRVAQTTQKLIWIGWVMLVLSGSMLLYMKGSVDSLTKIKLFLVAMIGANGVVLHGVKLAINKAVSDFKDLAPIHKYRIGLATLVSQVGWWGAILIGLAHGHWKHHIAWPASPFPYIFGILGTWVVLAVIGELVFARKEKRST
jgi:hypothetical protein